MSLINYLTLGALVALFVIYLVLIPIFRRRSIKRSNNEMKNFYTNLKVNDEVVLADGIIGQIKKKSADEFTVKIANGVEIRVNKFGVISKKTKEKEPVKDDD